MHVDPRGHRFKSCPRYQRRAPDQAKQPGRGPFCCLVQVRRKASYTNLTRTSVAGPRAGSAPIACEFKVSRASADYVRTMWESIGTIVMGRRLFDLVNGWEGDPPAGEHGSWCPTGPSRQAGIPKLPTTSSTA